MDICQCGKPLTTKKSRYEWLVKKGFSPKDAAAQVLYNPSTRIPPKTCCIVSLHTSVDTNKKLLERKQRIEEYEEDDITQSILPGAKKVRQIANIFVANQNETFGGEFMLMDANFDDPTILSRPFQQKDPPFQITNISPLPKTLRDRLGWQTSPLILWSGNIKLVPIIKIGDKILPGNMFKIVNVNGQNVKSALDTIDKSFLQSEIMYYAIQMTTNSDGNETPTHIITVKKQLPENIIA